MNEAMHYGFKFLQLIKDESMYGGYFSYEEYQELKNASDKDAFKTFIAKTRWNDVHVFEDPEHTFRDMRIIQSIQEEREGGLSWVFDCGCYGFPLGVVLMPFLFPIGIVICRRKIKKLKDERIELAQAFP